MMTAKTKLRKARATFTFPATDALLKQLHDAYAALVRRTPSVGRNDAEYTELKKLMMAVGEAVNVRAMQ